MCVEINSTIAYEINKRRGKENEKLFSIENILLMLPIGISVISDEDCSRAGNIKVKGGSQSKVC